jgi:hypothetical protein
LEHPAHSLLWAAAQLPPPGTGTADLFTIEVWQAWWGGPMRKATWLCFSRVPRSAIRPPLLLHASGSDRRREQLLSHHQRNATPPDLAAWLVQLARLAAPVPTS